MPQLFDDMPFNGKIGKIEYLMDTSLIPLGGGSIANMDALQKEKPVNKCKF